MSTPSSLQSKPTHEIDFKDFMSYHALLLPVRAEQNKMVVDGPTLMGELHNEFLSFEMRQRDVRLKSPQEINESVDTAVEAYLGKVFTGDINDMRVPGGRHIILVKEEALQRHGPERIIRTVHFGEVQDALNAGKNVPPEIVNFHGDELVTTDRDL